MHFKMNKYESRNFYISLKIDSLIGCEDLPGEKRHEEKGRGMKARGSSDLNTLLSRLLL